MKLVAQIKPLVDELQQAVLCETVEQSNALCNWISEKAWTAKVFRQFDLHHLCYQEARELSGLSSQMVIRCIAKVADAYKMDKKTQRTFRATGAIQYDARLLSWKGDRISLWTVAGRLKLSYICGEHQQSLLAGRTNAAELQCVRGRWFLNVVCDVPEPDVAQPAEFIGVDLGVANLATTSDGDHFTGKGVEEVRQRHFRTRKSLGHKMSRQRKRSTRRNARRAMKRIGNREQRFRKHTNHVISKRIVQRAEGTGRGIVIEDLKGIRGRTRFRKAQRAKMAGWSFHQLRAFLQYKAQLHGVPLVTVNPRNTSRTCSECGHCEKANRPSQDQFHCRSCGHKARADFNAAVNIAAVGAAVNQPERPEPLLA